VYSPINPALQADEAAYIIENAEAKLIVVEASHLEMIRGIRGRCPGLKNIVVVGDGAQGDEIPFAKLLADSADTAPAATVKESDPAAIIYTSGTTGRPKGAVLTQGNYVWDAQAIGEWVTMGRMTASCAFCRCST